MGHVPMAVQPQLSPALFFRLEELERVDIHKPC